MSPVWVSLLLLGQPLNGTAELQKVIHRSDDKRLLLTPNVRVKPAPTVGRQARAGENVPRTARPGLAARRWGSA